ncbi:MAG: HAMP domain-containing protein [Nocardiopsaceae bacterium]|jgi:signal transduction histidine kinase/HAMP domain-containing protein/ActR/RegA family two-component response regulator|nr:HAMP domain-containing protein [Nocardiopsaceae bacterium]
MTSATDTAQTSNSQLQELLDGLTAARSGDFSTRLPKSDDPLLDEIGAVFNGLNDQLAGVTSEVTRVAREVGTDGRLGGQADVPGLEGTWKDLTDSVNSMAGNLSGQVRDVARVATAVARGDLTHKIAVDAKGEMLELKGTLNTMVDELSGFADEVTRVAREVGTEGRLGGQARVPGVGGTWRDLTDSVNFMAGNLTSQVRNIAQVTTAVAKGDLSQKITVDAQGEIQELKNTVNTMVDQLSAFADEVTRVAREVGTDGRLGGQAKVPGVGGTWRDLTDSVNFMAGNLTGQVRDVARVATAVASGDLRQKITVDVNGEMLELKETLNTMVDQLSLFADEVTRVARDVGTEGILGGQARVRGVSGTWGDLTTNVNVMASNLTAQVRSIAQVATAVARGDLSQKITVEAKGEVAALAETINVMVDTLSAFAGEVTRVGREVGTEGILGGQAAVPNVAGTWKDLTENVNSMAGNLTSQVRNIAQVTTAVAQGDLSKKIDVDARGEILELKTTINTMVDQLSSFAAEVTRVAKEVGSEGQLGGQAEVEGVSGTWKRMTENVNELAGNLTRQVRAIAEVTSAVTTGDLTRSISVEARGEVADLKDNINAMVRSLRETTMANYEQDWLQTNLAKIAALMQGKRDMTVVAGLIMDELIPLVGGQHGTFYMARETGGDTRLQVIAGYGLRPQELTADLALGESLVGQAAKSKKTILVTDLPADCIKVSAVLGTAAPVNLIILPIVFEDQAVGVIEVGSFSPFTSVHREFMELLVETIGVNLNTIIANSRTEALLSESQRLATELQSRTGEMQAQQEELQKSNSDLEDQAAQLARQNRDIEIKNAEIEHARQELEQRARQLDLASRYKSQFLANMSHELRTPLNSLLILSELLSDNPEHNLSNTQVEYAEIIHSSGSDLLRLIDDILDLSRVEAGKMELHPERFELRGLLDDLRAIFSPLMSEKGLQFSVGQPADNVPAELFTDRQRLRQILHNLLANAVKFTDQGGVELKISAVQGVADGDLIEFDVSDTGVGIRDQDLDTIFGAFQQGDGTANRRYSGTGLGLAISRELAAQLGGGVTARSVPGQGSTFVLHLPANMPEDISQASGSSEEVGEDNRPAADSADSDLAQPDLSGEAARAHSGMHGKKVLVIDDDQRNAFAIRGALEYYGITVYHALDGQTGIQMLRSENSIDIVLMDVMMPELDGYATTAAIRLIPEVGNVPIIAVTARAMQGDREKSIDAGMNDYVTKPVDTEELLACMERALGLTVASSPS